MRNQEDGLRKSVLYIYTLTPMHVGVGGTPEVVDLPIQREKHTGYPVIYGSSLKGAIRSSFDPATANALFGNDETSTESYASALSFTDARILLFPAKTIKGIFAYVTSPFVLRRFERELNLLNVQCYSGEFEDGKVYMTEKGKEDLTIGNMLVLEEMSYTNDRIAILPEQSSILDALGVLFSEEGNRAFEFWKNKIKNHIVIVQDDDFRYLVKHGTEIVTRVKIDDEKGVVERGALWTEENVPSDTLFYSIVIFDMQRARNGRDFDDFKNKLQGKSIHIGGNTTIGRGFVYLKFYSGGENA